jgi:hypothetical protein
MKRALLAVLAAAALPAPASGAVFGELPFRAVPSLASCVTAPAPGLVSRTSASAVELLSAGADGLRPLTAPPMSPLPDWCPRVAVASSGAGVVVVPNLQGFAGHPYSLVVAVRDPGGAWGRTKALAPADEPETNYVAAVSERGDAAVAVTTDRSDLGSFPLLVARRAPGGAFGPPVTLLRSDKQDREPAVRLGYAAGGELVAAWTHADGRRFALDAAIAPPDGPFGPTQRIATVAPDAPGLVVAPDGRALLVFVAGGRTRVVERAPGAAGFAPPVALGRATDLNGDEIAAALGPDGAAAVAWRGIEDRGVTAATRPAAGAFGPPVVLARPLTGPMAGDETGPGTGDPIDLEDEDPALGGHLGVAVAGGEATLSWPQAAVTRGIAWRGVRVATVPLAGGHAGLQLLGSPLRDAVSQTPLTLADGTPAVAWADDRDRAGGRVHLAVAGAPAAVPARAPRVRTGPPRSTVLRGAAPLRLPVRCSAACDVRVQTPFDDATISLRRAGSAVAALDLAWVHRGRARRVQLRLASGAPGSTHPAVRRVTVRVRRVSGARSRASA